MICPICGTTDFTEQRVLSPELIAQWELEEHERDYIDEQQGFACTRCRANLRAMTLARAILQSFSFDGLFEQWAKTSTLSVLEINEAFTLTTYTSQMPGHVLARYPEVDMQALPYGDATFDLVLHSDTLEHVPDPILALRECLRVLRPAGRLAYTVPALMGRMSRSRAGLPPSYHGGLTSERSPYLVHTEFGADFWTYPLSAGFNRLELVTIRYPASVAIVAQKS